MHVVSSSLYCLQITLRSREATRLLEDPRQKRGGRRRPCDWPLLGLATQHDAASTVAEKQEIRLGQSVKGLISPARPEVLPGEYPTCLTLQLALLTNTGTCALH